MICLVFLPSDLKNIVEVFNLRNNDKGGGKVVAGPGQVSALDWVDFSKTMASGEKLYLLAHGDPMHVSSGPKVYKQYDAPALAGKLIAAKLPADVGAIKLVACNTGVATATTDPFCSVLSRELYKQSNQKINVRVTGVAGLEVVGKTGLIRGKTTGFAKAPEFAALDYDNNWKNMVDNWETEVRQMDLSTSTKIIEASEEMEAKTRKFFDELHKINALYISEKNASRFKSPVNV